MHVQSSPLVYAVLEPILIIEVMTRQEDSYADLCSVPGRIVLHQAE